MSNMLYRILAVVFSAVFSVGAVEVPLTVSESVGVARKAEPISSGVCFKGGEVKDVSRLTLVDANGKPVPSQFAPLVTLEGCEFCDLA